MPHQCTACGHAFEDGSKEMLSGCPDCGGNKFQFRPAGASDDAPTKDAGDSVGETASDAASTGTPGSGTFDPDSGSGPEPESRPQVDDGSSVAETVGRATTKVRDFVASTPDPPTDDPSPDAEWPGEWEGTTPSESGAVPSSDGDGEIIDADARRAARSDAPAENTAQASARTDVVSPSEIDADTAAGTTEAPGADTDAAGDSTPASDTSVGSSPDASAPSRSTDAETPGADPDAPPDGEVVGEPTGEEPDLTELREQLNDQFESIKILEPGQYELNLMELYDREEYIIALQENGRYVIQVPEQWIGEDPADR